MGRRKNAMGGGLGKKRYGENRHEGRAGRQEIGGRRKGGNNNEREPIKTRRDGKRGGGRGRMKRILGGLMREVGGESRAEGGPEDMGGVRDG